MIQPHLEEAVARERRLDLERAADCCSPVRAHRRAVTRVARRHRRPRLTFDTDEVTDAGVMAWLGDAAAEEA